jgi:hypothetical protein
MPPKHWDREFESCSRHASMSCECLICNPRIPTAGLNEDIQNLGDKLDQVSNRSLALMKNNFICGLFNDAVSSSEW